MGYYMSCDRTWLPGQVPRCKYCDGTATWESPTIEILLCDAPRCHTAYIEDQGFPIEHYDGPAQWWRCKACGEVWVYVDEACYQCTNCWSDDTEPVDEDALVRKGKY